MTKDLFPGQHSDEQIYLFVRKHWIVIFSTFSILFLMLIVPFIGIILLRIYYYTIFQGSIINILVILGSIYILIIAGLSLVGFIDYYLDVEIVTNKRLIDIKQINLFARAIDELELLHIEDISVHQKGFLATFLNFGTIYIQTAGTSRNFILTYLPHPQKVARQIMKLSEESIKTYDDKLVKGLGRRRFLLRKASPDKTEYIDQTLEKFQPPTLNQMLNIDEKSIKSDAPYGEIKKDEEVDLNQTIKSKILLKFNIEEKNINEVLQVLPSLKSPTINSLADENFVAVETVINKEEIETLIPKIKNLGAQDIIQSKITVL